MHFKKQWENFLKLYSQDSLPSFMLFYGEKGIGKSTFAQELALHIFNDQSQNNVKKQIENKAYPNYFINKEALDIDSTTEIRNFLNSTSLVKGTRILIIDDAELMTRSAANALLKIFEHDHKNTLIILICHNLYRLLPTIRSRFHKFFFDIPSLESENEKYFCINIGFSKILNDLGGSKFIQKIKKHILGNEPIEEDLFNLDPEAMVFFIKQTIYKMMNNNELPCKKCVLYYQRINNFEIESRNANLSKTDYIISLFYLTRIN